jgi:hypothetical protein
VHGFAARGEASTDNPASEFLPEKHEQNRENCEAQFSSER